MMGWSQGEGVVLLYWVRGCIYIMAIARIVCQLALVNFLHGQAIGLRSWTC
jgi:hypothetical protein